MTQTDKTSKKEQAQALTFANFSYLGQIQQALSKEQLQFIRETIAPSLADKQLLLFMYKAHRLGLDPLNNEIFAYFIELKLKMVHIVSLNLGRAVNFGGATATVRRTDVEQEFVVTVALSEYRQNNAIWNTRPETMIKKFPLRQVLTMAFPELFSGVYEDAEIEVLNGANSAPETLSVTLPESPTDNNPATDAQKKSVST